jgi:D-threo-aldose 1-dehydrogenase
VELMQRTLGRTGIPVSLLGFGGAPLGDLFAVHDDRVALDAVQAAVDGGITLFDTAPLYGHGLSEHRIGTVLKRAPREEMVICTKVGRTLHPAGRGGVVDRGQFKGGLPFHARYDYSADGVLRSIEQSLHRLGTSHLDIVLIHDVDVWTHGAAAVEAVYRQAVEGAYRALHDLRAQGAVRAIGVGLNEADMCARFAADTDIDCVLLAGRYTLLEQGAAGFLDLAQARGIGVMLGGVFNSGILATGSAGAGAYNYKPPPPAILERVQRFEVVCAAHGASLPHAALAFAAAHPAVASLVLGAVTPAEVARNLAAIAAPVPPALWPALRAAGLIAQGVPTP